MMCSRGQDEFSKGALLTRIFTEEQGGTDGKMYRSYKNGESVLKL